MRRTFIAAGLVLLLGNSSWAASPAATRAGRAGVTALVNNQYNDALESLTRAVSLAPDNPLWRLNLGWTYLALGQAQKALQAFVETAKRAPRDVTFQGWVLWGKALAYEQMGNCSAMAKELATWMSVVMDPKIETRFQGEAKKVLQGQIQIAREKIRTCPNRTAAARTK